MPVDVRLAREGELPAVMNALDGANLEVDAGRVRERIEGDDGSSVLVATEGGRILGALVLESDEVEAVAVRPGRRGQGVGTALVEAAAERRGSLTAEFDDRVRPFYESLGFAVEPVDDTGGCRFRGHRVQDR